MPLLRVIPCLDVRDDRVVKGVRFDRLADSGEPSVLAARYEAEGADEIVLLDVVASARRTLPLATVRAVRDAIALPLTVGGGVVTLSDAARLIDAGADRVSINSAAVRRPELLSQIAARFGRQATVLAIDVRRSGTTWEVVTRAGQEPTGLEAISWAAEGARRGAGELLVTAIDRDGTGRGYDLELLRAIVAAVDVPVIASGGAGTAADLVAAAEAGAEGLLVAGMLHRGESSVGALKRRLAADGQAVRRC
jgi:cyclase